MKNYVSIHITGIPLYDVPPIPDCSDLLAITSIKRSGITPEMIAEQMLESVRYWIAIHPGKDWMSIVPPPWKDYIRYNNETNST